MDNGLNDLFQIPPMIMTSLEESQGVKLVLRKGLVHKDTYKIVCIFKTEKFHSYTISNLQIITKEHYDKFPFLTFFASVVFCFSINYCITLVVR